MLYFDINARTATGLHGLCLTHTCRLCASLIQLPHLFVEYACLFIHLVHPLTQSVARLLVFVSLLTKLVALCRQAVTFKIKNTSQLWSLSAEFITDSRQ
jgi:hypothetical protein